MDAAGAVEARVTLRVAVWTDGVARDIAAAIGHPQCAEVIEIGDDGETRVVWSAHD